MPEVNNGDQTSPRQPSEEPSLADDFDVNHTTPSFSLASSFSVSSPPKKRKTHRSWIKYWSSITPLICGSLGPLVTLLALSGCADKWRTRTVNGIHIEQNDPIWVMAMTAIAIVVGFIANLFLLMRMMGRGNPKHLQYLSIILWTVESVINFGTIGLYVQIVGDDDGWVYAQGFWMTVCSAALSSVCAFLLSLNSFILPSFGKRGKMGLSGPQRVFVIQIMFFIFWLAIGAAVFCGVEHFTFSESVYFVDVTVSTVGFAVPTTTLGRALVMPYAIIGIISLGLVVSSIRTVVIERTHLRKRLIEAIMHREERHLEHLQRQVRRRHAAVMGVSMMVMGPHSQEIHDRSLDPYMKMIAREELRKSHLLSAEKWKEIYSLAVSFLIFSLFWLAGAAIFSHTEGWTFFDGLYFCMIFYLTIGYGDFVVTSNVGRAIYIVYSLFTIPIITIHISLLSDTVFSKLQKKAENLGVREREDGRYRDTVAHRQERRSRWKFYSRKSSRRKSTKPRIEADVERGDDVSTTNDEILREEVLEEVESIQEEVNEEVDSELGINKKDAGMIEQAMSAEREMEDSSQQNLSEDIDDEKITEKDVELALKENRTGDH